METGALLAALRLQIEWGADEALATLPVDRVTAPAAPGFVPAAGAPALPAAWPR